MRKIEVISSSFPLLLVEILEGPRACVGETLRCGPLNTIKPSDRIMERQMDNL